ncbi:MAG: hypothetical protein A2X28_05335 [Elusimicrobia bacterium GWA2_56_46]|nr:MAG: hypothetical protein A2X28_05335 [Elusimicrobia bacterium GWA2_56_46]OGR55284.1 MAG: hypothetical protein A2X39_04500 [Elusimicrobia bacterium GWC2_56_31]HBB66571.1 hypothetical protein [Elusimicrobiota bacterium]HBW23502.1 hypothetical protein [Elusimicrobiota bacterium]
MRKTRTYRLALLAAAGAVFFTYAWENVQATRLGYGIEGLRREITDLENANNYLKKEIQVSLSPEKLQADAARIGLVYPEPDALVLLDGDAGAKPSKGWLASVVSRKWLCF